MSEQQVIFSSCLFFDKVAFANGPLGEALVVIGSSIILEQFFIPLFHVVMASRFDANGFSIGRPLFTLRCMGWLTVILLNYDRLNVFAFGIRTACPEFFSGVLSLLGNAPNHVRGAFRAVFLLSRGW